MARGGGGGDTMNKHQLRQELRYISQSPAAGGYSPVVIMLAEAILKLTEPVVETTKESKAASGNDKRIG